MESQPQQVPLAPLAADGYCEFILGLQNKLTVEPQKSALGSDGLLEIQSQIAEILAQKSEGKPFDITAAKSRYLAFFLRKLMAYDHKVRNKQIAIESPLNDLDALKVEKYSKFISENNKQAIGTASNFAYFYRLEDKAYSEHTSQVLDLWHSIELALNEVTSAKTAQWLLNSILMNFSGLFSHYEKTYEVLWNTCKTGTQNAGELLSYVEYKYQKEQDQLIEEQKRLALAHQQLIVTKQPLATEELTPSTDSSHTTEHLDEASYPRMAHHETSASVTYPLPETYTPPPEPDPPSYWESQEDSHFQVNPANGLPMISDFGIDVMGNNYGFNE